MIMLPLLPLLLLILSHVESFKLSKFVTSLKVAKSPDLKMGMELQSILKSTTQNLFKLLISSAIVPLIFNTDLIPPAFAITDINPISSSISTTLEVKQENIYFGVGCFWHVQHEFVNAEKQILGRKEDQSTSLAGYAGGKSKLGNNPRLAANDAVCYHNMLGVGDYGKNGYGEVVGMTVPSTNVIDFAKEYFSLFSNGDRPDKGDRGPEYRSMIGLPGGVNSEYFAEIEAVARGKGLALKEGKGSDADTLGARTVWVMDTAAYPFRQAEIYHQYHDGFMSGEQYPESYNSLIRGAVMSGKVKSTGCPDMKM